MDNIIVFKNEKFGQIRLIEFDEEYFFIVEDVASVIGLDLKKINLMWCIDECDLSGCSITNNLGNIEKVAIINQRGLHQLFGLGDILHPARKWIICEVIPSIPVKKYAFIEYKDEFEYNGQTYIFIRRRRCYTENGNLGKIL